MKFNLITILLTAVSCFSVASCNGEEDKAPAGSLLELNATLSSYQGAGGTQVPLWKSSSQILVIDTANGKSATAKPAMPEMQTSTFTMKIDGISSGDECLAATPASMMVFKNNVIQATIPVEQNGTMDNTMFAGRFTHGSKSDEVTLKPVVAYLSVNVNKGDFSVIKVVVRSNSAADKFAGPADYSEDMAKASCKESSITVTPKNASCSKGGLSIPVMIAPCTLVEGLTVTVTTSNGEVITNTVEGPLKIEAGSVLDIGTKASDSGRALLACGSTKVYLIKTENIKHGELYNKGLKWSWDCTSIQGTCAGAKSSSHIDDVVICNDKKQILVTCSNNNGWCVLLEPDYSVDGKATLLFWTNKSTNAHSAELLPGGYVAVACSTDGGDCIQLYKIGENNSVKSSYPLSSAHGVVWNNATKRLYAVGGNNLQIYAWDQDEGKLTLENTINTKSYATGLHDISLVDDNTLIMGSSKCALYKIKENSFQQVTWFNDSRTAGIKSLNYNPKTDELYYTYAVAATHEGNYDWSTQTIRYTNKPFSNYDISQEMQIKVPDINMYKVRVMNW